MFKSKLDALIINDLWPCFMTTSMFLSCSRLSFRLLFMKSNLMTWQPNKMSSSITHTCNYLSIEDKNEDRTSCSRPGRPPKRGSPYPGLVFSNHEAVRLGDPRVGLPHHPYYPHHPPPSYSYMLHHPCHAAVQVKNFFDLYMGFQIIWNNVQCNAW